MTDASIYETMGGEPTVRRLVEQFYTNMFEFEGVDALRDMHEEDLDATKEKLFMYFSGWFGGPPLFVDQ